MAAAKQLLNQKNTHTDGVRERESHTHTHTHTQRLLSHVTIGISKKDIRDEEETKAA